MPQRSSLPRCPLGNAAANDYARSIIGDLVKHLFVCALEGRIRNLKGVECLCLCECQKIRGRGGDTDKASLSSPSNFLKDLQEPSLLNRFHGRIVHLQDIDVIGLHPAEALVDVPADPIRCPQVTRFESFTVLGDVAAAFRGENKLVAPMAYIPANPFLAPVVIRRRVDEVNAGVQYRIQEAFRLIVIDFSPKCCSEA